MNNYVKSEKGNTLLIVLGFVIVLSLVIAPLALRTSSGLLQAHSGGLKENAYSDAYSAMTMFAKLYEEAKLETEFAFGGLNSEEAWIALMDGDITAKVLAKYPKVAITRAGSGHDAEWIFSAKSGPNVVNYDQSGSYYRSGQVMYSLKASGSSNPLPTLPPDTGGGDEDDGPPTLPIGGKILLKAMGKSKEMQYNKMFAACTFTGSGETAIGQSAKALIPEHLYFDNRHDDERAGTPQDPKFNQMYGDFLDYYTNIHDRVDAYPFYSGAPKGTNDPRLDSAKNINPNQLTGNHLSVPASAWPAAWNGSITVNGKMNDSSARIHSFSEPVFVGNDLTFRPGSNEVLNVEVLVNAPSSNQGFSVGGNLTIDAGGNNAKLVIGHSAYVKGNFNASGNNNWEVVIKGDLIVGGDLNLNVNKFKHFIVEGDIIVGGSATIAASNSTENKVDIKGSLQAGGNISIAPYPAIAIGKDLLSGGKLDFTSKFERIVSIGGSVAANNDITMQGSNANANLLIGQHLISNGSIKITNGMNLNSKIAVGGTLAAAGNVLAVNTVNSTGMLIVKDNIIAGGNFGLTQSTGDSMNGKLLMETANLIVFGDATFGNNLNGGYQRMLVSGIAIKGYVDFNINDYNNNNSADRASICITSVTVP